MKILYNHNLVETAKYLRNHMTFGEKVAWRFLRNKQMEGFDFHRQKPIGNYIADFYCSQLNLVIEIDGISHEDEHIKENDMKKDQYFKGIGLNVLRFTDDEIIGNGETVEKRIREYIRTHPPSPSS